MNRGGTIATRVKADSERRERQERKKHFREKEKEYTQQKSIACITRTPLPPSKNTKPYSLQCLMDGYSNSHSKPLNFVA